MKISELAKIAKQYGLENSNSLRDSIVSEYTDIMNSLNTIEEKIIDRSINMIPVYKINEGYTKKLDSIIDKKEKAKGLKESYLIDLESLKYIVQDEQCSLQEAMQKIKDINYIGDLYDIAVVLPENINENITMENFIKLYKSLNEANINLVSTKDLKNTEFVKEASAFFANKMSKNMLEKK